MALRGEEDAERLVGGKVVGQANPDILSRLKVERDRSDRASTRFKREPNWLLMTPLLFAPILPGIKIVFRKNPALCDKLFKGTLAVAITHSSALMMGFYPSAGSAMISEK